MLIVKLIYLLLLAGLAVFSVLYIDSLAVILLICALILPVMLKICLLWVKLSAHASLQCNISSCTVHESIPVSVLIENRCPLFFPKVNTSVSVCHAFSHTPETIRLRFPLHGRNTTRLTFYIHAECCGAVQIQLQKLNVLDCFHLFHTKIKKQDDEIEILVLPQKLDLLLQETAEAVYTPESNRYADKAGDDPSELFNIREYHAGDAVSRIHWKLSSKSDKLLIKELGFPIEKQVLLLIEYLPGNDSDAMGKMQQAQAFLTLIYSMAVQLAESDMICVLVWCNNSRLIYKPLKSKNMLPEIFCELYHALDNMIMHTQNLREILAGQQYSSVTLITNDKHAQLLPVLENQTDAGQKNLAVMTEEPCFFSSDSVTVRSILPEQITESISGLVI